MTRFLCVPRVDRRLTRVRRDHRVVGIDRLAGKSPEAARKFTYRHKKRGDTPQDTVSVLREGRKGS